MNRFLIAAVAVLALVGSAFAQEFRASISGQITDSTGAVVAGASVVVTNLERNTSTQTVSNNSGRYMVEFLIPGHYTLTAEAAGFKKFVNTGLTLEASDRAALDIALDIGAQTDSVTVSGQAVLLETETGSRASTIENRVLENIPTNGRNLFSLQYSLPGVIKNQTAYWGSMELWAYDDVNGVSINGGRNGENETLIDGLASTKADRGATMLPSLSSVQEFSVQSNIYDAQYGRFGGGVTSITVKSGTNAIHGELHEFLKNTRLDAPEWALNALGSPRRRFQNNTYGFEFDGPVFIPKVFDGRNKLFFMYSWERGGEHIQSSAITTLPTPAMLQGDFSNLVTSDNRPITIYDPRTTRLLPDGTYVRDPFPGNKIPADRINPVAAKVISLYPPPTGPGVGPSNFHNYSVLKPQTQIYLTMLGKMDYRFSPKSNISFRYGQTPWTSTPAIVWGNNAAEPSSLSTRAPRNWGADWTYTLTPSLLFNLRGGLARFESFHGNSHGAGYNPAQLGFPSSLVSQFTSLQFPNFVLGPYQQLGSAADKSYETDDTYSIQPNMSWIHGRQSYKFGAEMRRYNQNFLQPGSAAGKYVFGKNWTQADPLRSDALSGNEIASFLLGLPKSGFVNRNIDPAYRNNYYALFVQDDWKVTPRLTVNLGLRWDYETPRTERYNRMVRGFAFDQTSPIATQAGLNLKGGLLFAGNSGDKRLAFEPDRKHFEPRVGVAWNFANKWVMRGGYGISYLGQNSNGAAAGYSRPTNFIASTDGGITSAASLSDPFPSNLYPSGLLPLIGNSQGLSTNLGQDVTAQYLNRPLPYSQQYSFGFQHQLGTQWVVDAAYSGNITRRLPVAMGLNYIPTSVQNSMPVGDRPGYFTAAVPNPLAGLLPGSSFNDTTIPRQQLLVAYPQFNSVTITDVPNGSSRYDSFQSKLVRRFAQGLAVQASYTISKFLEQVSVLNPQDVNLSDLRATKLEKRLATYDAPQSFSGIVSYELPVGRGKRFGSSMNRVLNGIVGNWNLNVEYNIHSGFPFLFPNAAPLVAKSANLQDKGRDAVAKTHGRPQFDPGYDVYFNTAIFPTEAQAPYTLQNFPTVFPDVRSKILNVVDASISKEFALREKLKLQFRTDFHNAFNHPWFGTQGSNDVTDPNFGQLFVYSIDANSEPRLIVLAMKIVF